MKNELTIPHEDAVKALLLSGWQPGSIRMHVRETYDVDVTAEEIMAYAETIPNTDFAPFAVLRKRFKWQPMNPDAAQLLFDLLAFQCQEFDALLEIRGSIEDTTSEDYRKLQSRVTSAKHTLWEMALQVATAQKKGRGNPEDRDAPEEQSLRDLMGDGEIVDVK